MDQRVPCPSPSVTCTFQIFCKSEIVVRQTKEAHSAPLRLCMVEGFAPQVCSEELLGNLGMAEGHAGLLLFALDLAGKGKGRPLRALLRSPGRTMGDGGVDKGMHCGGGMWVAMDIDGKSAR